MKKMIGLLILSITMIIGYTIYTNFFPGAKTLENFEPPQELGLYYFANLPLDFDESMFSDQAIKHKNIVYLEHTWYNPHSHLQQLQITYTYSKNKQLTLTEQEIKDSLNERNKEIITVKDVQGIYNLSEMYNIREEKIIIETIYFSIDGALYNILLGQRAQDITENEITNPVGKDYLINIIEDSFIN